MRRTAATLAVAALAFGCASTDDTTTAGSDTTVATATNDSISQGAGSKDASADVTLGELSEPDALGFRTAAVTVTNNSSKRSNYIIDLALESADGKTQYDTALATANNVDPGQTATPTATPFTKAKDAPADAVVKVKSVTRLAAS